jgi:hypothetical protein
MAAIRRVGLTVVISVCATTTSTRSEAATRRPYERHAIAAPTSATTNAKDTVESAEIVVGVMMRLRLQMKSL